MVYPAVANLIDPARGRRRPSRGVSQVPHGSDQLRALRLLHAVYDAGYRGPCVLEIFSQDVADSLYDTDLHEVLADNRSALNQAWRLPRRLLDN